MIDNILSTSKVYGTNAERLAMNLAGNQTEIYFYETDTGSEYLWKGSEWVHTSTIGAAHVLQEIAPSAYTGQKATSTTAASAAVATGTSRVVVTNESSTAGEFVRIGFGTSALEATDNAALGEPVMPAQRITIRIPPGSTHIGYKAATGTPNITLIQGV